MTDANVPAEPADGSRDTSQDASPIFSSLSSENGVVDGTSEEEFEFDPEHAEADYGNAEEATVDDTEVDENDESWGV